MWECQECLPLPHIKIAAKGTWVRVVYLKYAYSCHYRVKSTNKVLVIIIYVWHSKISGVAHRRCS